MLALRTHTPPCGFCSAIQGLSTTAKSFFETAARGRRKIAIAPISLAEVVYLVEKNRLPVTAFDDLKAALRNPNHMLAESMPYLPTRTGEVLSPLAFTSDF